MKRSVCVAMGLVWAVAGVACGGRTGGSEAAESASAAAGTSASTSRLEPDGMGPTEPAPSAPVESYAVVAAAPTPEVIRWIAVGGGSGPEDNQVQMEADLAGLVARLGHDGVVLYAGGPGTRAVQIEERTAEDEPGEDRVLALLGELLDPRGARAASFRATTLAVHDEDTIPALAKWLGRANAPRLDLIVAGHGSAGEAAAENQVVFWGGLGLRPGDLAEMLAVVPEPRETRVIMTTCYSGAFADVVFAGADPQAEVATPMRCGFFATSATRVASGCDPDPDRQAVEGYLVHVLPALEGKDRNGRALPAEQIDFDHDGRISLAEAHARARIASRGFDVPTSTATRWLEVRVPDVAREGTVEATWPEEQAVIDALSARLEVHDADALAMRLAALDAASTKAAELQAAASDEEDALAREAIGELLARWPELGDPWHPRFRAVYAAARGEIATWLQTSPRYQAYEDARDRSNERAARADDAALAEAPFERLAAARAAVARAQVITRRGGNELATFEAIRQCERRALDE